MKISLYILLFTLLSSFGYSQITNGKIKIRKSDFDLVGKSLALYDLRTRECGTIQFQDDSNCTLTFTYKKEELKNIRIFLNSRADTKVVACSYELISDTTLTITKGDFKDTCIYKYINKTTNLVKFMHLPQGVFEDKNYAFFYGLDSVVYSQSFLRTLTDFRFTDSILEIDSIYKTIMDEDLKKELNEKLKQNISEYKKSINFSYFAGKYELNGFQINLLNRNETYFATLFLQNNNNLFSVFTHCKFDIDYSLISIYTHKIYGSVTFNYDKAYVHFYIPGSRDYKEVSKPKIHHTDTVKINYPLAKSPYLYLQGDTFNTMSTEYFDYVKFTGIIGGLYTTHITSLNGLKIPYNPIYFGVGKAVTLIDKTSYDTVNQWNYKINNGNFFLYNSTDTFIDEMKSGLDGFRFTYKNNQPYVFGAYHRKNREKKSEDFIVLFSNNHGVKFTASEFIYKYAKQSVYDGKIEEKAGITYSHFTYSCTEKKLWIEYQNGNYEELDFFNNNKAIKQQKSGEKAKIFYLLY